MKDTTLRKLERALNWAKQGERRFVSFTYGCEYGIVKTPEEKITCKDNAKGVSYELEDDFTGDSQKIDDKICEKKIDQLDKSIANLLRQREEAASGCV